jgi:hypothetical protein
MGGFDSMQYGIVTESQNLTCEYYSYYSWTPPCNKKSDFEDYYNQNCLNKEQCKIPVSSTYLDITGCDDYKGPQTKLYFRALCTDVDIPLIWDFKVSKEIVGYIVAGVDALLSLVFVFMILM